MFVYLYSKIRRGAFLLSFVFLFEYLRARGKIEIFRMEGLVYTFGPPDINSFIAVKGFRLPEGKG